MISQRLQDKITPHLKKIVTKDTYRKFPWMFNEVYYTVEDHGIGVNLRPEPYAEIGSLQFDLLTGTFLRTTNWEETKRRGYTHLSDCEDAQRHFYKL